MSKASEYVKAVNDVLEFRDSYGNVAAKVCADGWLDFRVDLRPDDALRLAAWIQDVFGEDGE